MNVGPAGFSPDGKLLATTSHARLRFWDPSTGTEAGAIDTPPLSASPLDRSPRAFIHGLAFSPDKRWLALGVSSTLNSEISVFELSTGRSVGTMPGTGPMAFSPDGRLLAFGTGNLGTIRGLGNQDERSVQLWDVRSFRQKGTVKLAGSLRGASSFSTCTG